MRPTMTTMTITMPILLAVAALGACNWTKFDDLADETWVDSTGKPDVKSSDWGVAIQRGADSTGSQNGGTLAIIGAGNVNTFSELTYGETGKSHFAPNSLDLGAQGIMTLDTPTILLASPASSEIALVTTGNASSIVVAAGTDTLLVTQIFTSNATLGNAVQIASTPDAATYMLPPRFPGLPAIDPAPAPIVGVGAVVMGNVINLSSADPDFRKQPACRLADGTGAQEVRALGAVPGAPGPSDDLLVWGKGGRLLRYAGSVFNGCQPPPAPDPQPVFQPSVADKPAFEPGKGSQILRVDDTHVLLAGVGLNGEGFLQVFESTPTTLKPIGNAVSNAGLRSAAILDVGGTKYVVAGYPAALVDSKKAGQVLIFKVDATGLNATQVATLNDAQPDANQSFGRAVTVMPYRGHNVLAVAADNEVFVYFRATLEDGSDLYGETRQGQ